MGYVSNGCVACDAILGTFFLEEALQELLAEGATYAELPQVGIAFPLAALPLEWDGEGDESPATSARP